MKLIGPLTTCIHQSVYSPQIQFASLGRTINPQKIGPEGFRALCADRPMHQVPGRIRPCSGNDDEYMIGLTRIAKHFRDNFRCHLTTRFNLSRR